MPASVTVGILFYAGTKPEHFQAAVDSILAQSLLPIEIHLIQNGPVSAEISSLVRNYLETDLSVKCLTIEKNIGRSYATNLSILTTTSTYYAKMDSDDIAHPQRLECQIQYLEAHPEIDILGTWASEFETSYKTEPGFLRRVPTKLLEMRKMFHYRNPFVHPSVVFRRSVFAKIGLYNPAFLMAEDLELWSRAFSFGVNATNIPQALLYYRFPGSIQRRAASVYYITKARYQFNTGSIWLNVLKVLSILFRLMPYSIQLWAYKNLR